MRNKRTTVLLLLSVVSLAGCWRDPAEVAAEYEDAWLAAHPQDAAISDASDTLDADTVNADAIDAVDAQDVAGDADAADVLDAPDAKDLCVGVTCTPKNGCQTSTCNPATGQCSGKFLPDTVKCDDASACTVGDMCSGGECVGTALVCDDKNVCTDDSCDVKSGCVYLPNSATCTDDSACTSGDGCKAGSCQHAPVVCDDGNVCTNNNCDPTSGCVYPPNTATCTDNDACSEADSCANTVCDGLKVDCDDANSCTADACDTASGCSHVALSGGCNDGDPCTLPDSCVSGACVGGAFAFGLHTLDSGTFDQVWGAASAGASSWLAGSSAATATGNADFSLWSVLANGGIGGQRTAGDSAHNEVGRIVVPTTGGVWVLGDRTATGSGPTPAFAWFGDDLTTGIYAFPTTDLSWRLTGQAALGSGWLLAGNRQQTGQPLHAWIGVATLKTGAAPTVVVTSEWLANDAQDSRIDALVQVSDGSFLGVGTVANASGGDDLSLVKIKSTGDVLNSQKVPVGAGPHRVVSATATADGGLLVLAMTDDVTPATLELLHLAKDLTLDWQVPIGANLWLSATLVPVASGSYIVGTQAGALERGAVVHLDTQGQTQWSYLMPLAVVPQRLTAAVAQSDGRLVAYGWQGTSDADGLELALDQWGSDACTPTGNCNSLSVTATDDGNPCTLDKCDIALGIVHTPVADGSWCDDGVACTVGDACVTATCIGGPRLFSKTFSGRTLYHMEAVAAGGFVLCGSTNDLIGSAYITWVDAAGKQKLDNIAPGTAANPGRGCAQGVDEAIWQAGWSGALSVDGARVRKFDLVSQNVVFDKSYGGVQFTSVIAHPQGGVLALGSDQPQARVSRILANGDLAWDWHESGLGDADNANDAVFLNDGSAVVVGEKHTTNGAMSAFAVRLDAAGKALWTQAFTGITGRLLALAIAPDGTLTAVGAQGNGAWVVRLDADTGTIKDSILPPAPQGTTWHDIAYFPSTAGGPNSQVAWLVGGAGGQAIYARVAGDSFAGKPETLSNVNQGTAPAYRSAVIDPSGDVIFAGNTTQAQLVRTDAWYHQTCTAAGTCLGFAPAGCDDNNPCTLDDCDGTLGCKHSNVPPNSPCQGGTCQGGQCK